MMLKSGDKVRLTGRLWTGEKHIPPKGEIVTITRVIEDSFGKFVYRSVELNTATSDYYSESWFRSWGCEVIEDEEDQEADNRFAYTVEAYGSNTLTVQNYLKGTMNSIYLTVESAQNTVLLAFDDEKLDELITTLMYVKMERDKLKE